MLFVDKCKSFWFVFCVAYCILAEIEQQDKIFCCCCWAHTMCHCFLCWKRHKPIPLSFRTHVTHPISNPAKRTTCSSSSSKCTNVRRNTVEAVLCVWVENVDWRMLILEKTSCFHTGRCLGQPSQTYPMITYRNSPSLVASPSTAEEQH